MSGRGTIHSYVIVVQAIQPGFRDWAPYPVVVVELDEQRGEPTPDDGIRLVTNLVTPDFQPEREERVAIGARVEVCFQPLGPDGGPAAVPPHGRAAGGPALAAPGLSRPLVQRTARRVLSGPARARADAGRGGARTLPAGHRRAGPIALTLARAGC